MEGNTCSIRHVTTDLVIGACAATAVTEVTVAVPGAVVGDQVSASCRQTLTAGVALVGGRVTVAGTVALSFLNVTAAPIDPGDTFDFDIIVLRATGNVS